MLVRDGGWGQAPAEQIPFEYNKSEAVQVTRSFRETWSGRTTFITFHVHFSSSCLWKQTNYVLCLGVGCFDLLINWHMQYFSAEQVCPDCWVRAQDARAAELCSISVTAYCDVEPAQVLWCQDGAESTLRPWEEELHWRLECLWLSHTPLMY